MKRRYQSRGSSGIFTLECFFFVSQVEEARRRQEEAAAALIAATTTPQHQHVNEGDQDEGDDDEETPNGDVSGGRDLISESDLSNSIRDPVEDRLTLAEKNERLQNQLKVRFCFVFF